MPELPEAETIVRTLSPHLHGRRFERVVVHRKDIANGRAAQIPRRLNGRRVSNVRRSGKRVVIEFDEGTRLVVALGMTGRLTVVESAEPLLNHTQFQAAIAGTKLDLRFRDPRRFGGLWLLDATEEMVGPRLGPVGPDPLEIRWTEFRLLLQRQRQIKALLLDQKMLAGMGNIYCDEALHRAGIHPLTRACDLPDAQGRDLLRTMRRVLRDAIADGGTTFMDYRNADGRPGGFQRKHRVYNREGEPCRTCKTPIIRITAAGRSSHLCPTCQPLTQ